MEQTDSSPVACLQVVKPKQPFLCGSLPVPLDVGSFDDLVRNSASAVTVIRDRPYIPHYKLLPAETDLNTTPSNWLPFESLAPLNPPDSAEFPGGPSIAWGGNYLSQPIAKKCEALAVSGLAGYGDEIDVIAPADILKEIFKTPYSKARLSVTVHRVGRTLILNSGHDADLDKVQRKKNKSKAMERALFSKFVHHSVHGSGGEPSQQEASQYQAQEVPSAPYGMPTSGAGEEALDHTNVESVVVDHGLDRHRMSMGFENGGAVSGDNEEGRSGKSPSVGLDNKRRHSGSKASTSQSGRGRKGRLRARAPQARGRRMKARLWQQGSAGPESRDHDDSTHEETAHEKDPERPQPSPEGFLRVLFWQFQHLRMLLGSDLLLFSNKDHAAVSLHLMELEREANPLQWLDAWLDNVMASVSELAVCYHRNGVVQGYELLKTDDIFLLKGLSGDGSTYFHPHVVQQNAFSVLQFLQENCIRDPGTYWLYKDTGDDLMQLFDLTPSPGDEQHSFEGLPGAGDSRKCRYSLPLAMLLYRLAQRLSKSKDESTQQKCTRLFAKCLELMGEHEHPGVRATAHEQVARLFMACFNELSEPSKHLLLEAASSGSSLPLPAPKEDSITVEEVPVTEKESSVGDCPVIESAEGDEEGKALVDIVNNSSTRPCMEILKAEVTEATQVPDEKVRLAVLTAGSAQVGANTEPCRAKVKAAAQSCSGAVKGAKTEAVASGGHGGGGWGAAVGKEADSNGARGVCQPAAESGLEGSDSPPAAPQSPASSSADWDSGRALILASSRQPVDSSGPSDKSSEKGELGLMSSHSESSQIPLIPSPASRSGEGSIDSNQGGALVLAGQSMAQPELGLNSEKQATFLVADQSLVLANRITASYPASQPAEFSAFPAPNDPNLAFSPSPPLLSSPANESPVDAISAKLQAVHHVSQAIRSLRWQRHLIEDGEEVLRSQGLLCDEPESLAVCVCGEPNCLPLGRGVQKHAKPDGKMRELIALLGDAYLALAQAYMSEGHLGRALRATELACLVCGSISTASSKEEASNDDEVNGAAVASESGTSTCTSSISPPQGGGVPSSAFWGRLWCFVGDIYVEFQRQLAEGDLHLHQEASWCRELRISDDVVKEVKRLRKKSGRSGSSCSSCSSVGCSCLSERASSGMSASSSSSRGEGSPSSSESAEGLGRRRRAGKGGPKGGSCWNGNNERGLEHEAMPASTLGSSQRGVASIGSGSDTSSRSILGVKSHGRQKTMRVLSSTEGDGSTSGIDLREKEQPGSVEVQKGNSGARKGRTKATVNQVLIQACSWKAVLPSESAGTSREASQESEHGHEMVPSREERKRLSDPKASQSGGQAGKRDGSLLCFGRRMTVDWEVNLTAAAEYYAAAASAFAECKENSERFKGLEGGGQSTASLRETVKKKGWVYNELGRRRLARGAVPQAEDAFEMAISAFREVKDLTNTVLVYCNLGHGRRAAAEKVVAALPSIQSGSSPMGSAGREHARAEDKRIGTREPHPREGMLTESNDTQNPAGKVLRARRGQSGSLQRQQVESEGVESWNPRPSDAGLRQHHVEQAKRLYLEALQYYTNARKELLKEGEGIKRTMGGLWSEVHTQFGHTYLRLGMLLASEEVLAGGPTRSCSEAEELTDGTSADLDVGVVGRGDVSGQRGGPASRGSAARKDMLTPKEAMTKALILYDCLGKTRVQEAAYAHHQLACHHRDRAQLAAAARVDKGVDSSGRRREAVHWHQIRRYVALAEIHWQKALEIYKPSSHPDLFVRIALERADLCLATAPSPRPPQVWETAVSQLLESRHAWQSRRHEEPGFGSEKQPEPHELEPSPQTRAKLCQRIQFLLKEALALATMASKQAGGLEGKGFPLSGQKARESSVRRLRDMYRVALSFGNPPQIEELYQLSVAR